MSRRRHQGIKASRHEGISASPLVLEPGGADHAMRPQAMPRPTRAGDGRARKDGPARPARGARVAFSLIEVLLAVFILGVGVIAIAALFPAGIAQQRQSVDDTIGPIVANNALAVLRSKLRPEDFGFLSPSPTIEGDFPWSRPAFFTKPATLLGSVFVSAGSISIFNTVAMGGAGAITPSEIPPAGPPDPPIIITQAERYYPMRSQLSTDPFPPRPQYVWDCMFRRFQGKVMVAIFVYRVTIPGGGSVTYAVPPNYSSTTIPPMPVWLDLAAAGTSWDADANLATPEIEPFVFIPGTDAGTPYDPSDHAQAWQAPAQWLLDQNNNVHRVLSGRRNESDGPVELVRPVSSMPPLPVYYLPGANPSVEDVVTNIWYIPVEVKLDTNTDGEPDLPATLTPVYVTVREL